MSERIFPVLPARRKRNVIGLVLRILAVGVAVWIAQDSGLWLWWVAAGLMAVLAAITVISLTQRKYVAKVDAKGVTVMLAFGREMFAPWDKIEAHTIDPVRSIGAVLERADGGRVRVLPISIGAMGAEAAAELIEELKKRRPNIEYRVPSAKAVKR